MSNKYNNEFKTVLKSIIVLLGRSIWWNKDWYVLSKITVATDLRNVLVVLH